jgi:L-arabonate dehydrase
MAERQAARVPGSAPGPKTGYQKLYVEHVLQADEGCDFDFLVGNRGSAVPRHSH